MKTVAITNHKGGSAKTTTAVNLAAAFGELGYRVLLIDMDPQGSATDWLGSQPAGRGILDAYLGHADVTDGARTTTAPGVQLIPSSPWLVPADRQQEIDIALGFIRAVEHLPARWDFVLVDCPPSQSPLTVAPLAACQDVIVPIEAHILAIAGLVTLVDTMQAVRERLNPDLRLAAIVACRVNRTRHAREVIERLRAGYPDQMLDGFIRENISLAEAPSFRLPITQYAPASTGTQDYRAVAAELLRGRRLESIGRRLSG